MRNWATVYIGSRELTMNQLMLSHSILSWVNQLLSIMITFINAQLMTSQSTVYEDERCQFDSKLR